MIPDKALILAGGKGTRLNEITKGLIPKPLVEVAGKPVIVRAIENVRRYKITDVTISVGFLYEKIIERLGDGKGLGVNIKYVIEDQPLGSGGALYYLKNEHIDQLLVCPGDVVFDFDVRKMSEFHRSKGALITLFAHPNTHPYDSDLIIADADGRVIGINKKNSERNFYYSNLVNAGIFILSGETLSYFKEKRFVNMEHDFVSSFIAGGRVFSYRSPEYVRDVGTPERLLRAEADLKSGVVERKNLANKQRAVFLDRDGTINVYKGFISSPDDLELLPGAARAVKAINESDKRKRQARDNSIQPARHRARRMHFRRNALDIRQAGNSARQRGSFYRRHILLPAPPAFGVRRRSQGAQDRLRLQKA